MGNVKYAAAGNALMSARDWMRVGYLLLHEGNWKGYRTGSGLNWVLVVPSLDLLVTYNGRTPASRKAEIDRESLARLFAAVPDRYVTCDWTEVNGAG